MYLLGIDIGTTSISAVLVDGESGGIVKSITTENRGVLQASASWESIQDPAWLLSAVYKLITELRRDEVHISGIGITGQMHGILYVDREGDAVSPLFTWLDQRGALPYKGNESFAEHLTRLTAYPISSGFGMVTHYYNLVNGILPEHAVKLCTIADFVAMKLVKGREPLMDATNAAGLGLFQLEHGVFDSTGLRAAGIGMELLPEIRPSGSVIGHTEEGIPVACAMGDNQASFLGAVRDIHSSVLVNIGTGSQLSVFHEEAVQAAGLETRPFPGGGFLLVGASLSGGKSYALLEGFFREVCYLFTGFEGNLYERMNTLAMAEPPNDTKLKVNTQFYGTRGDPSKQGWIGPVSAESFTPHHLITGFLEGMVDELAGFREVLPESMKSRSHLLVGSGNGVRSNNALRKLLSNAFRMPIEIPAYPEEASYGAAISAGVGIGLYKSFTTAPGMPRMEGTIS